MTCPHCQGTAEFKGYRPKTVQSVLGPVRLRRGYYHCGRCGKGLSPFDDETGLGTHRLTPGALRVVSLLALTCDSFAEAADKALPEACGLPPSPFLSFHSTPGIFSEALNRRLLCCARP